MKGSSGMIAWLLLVAVLAVPSFLFYNWWTSKNVSDAAALTPVQGSSAPAIFERAPDAAASAAAAASATAAVTPAAPDKAAVSPADAARLQPELQPRATGQEAGRQGQAAGPETQTPNQTAAGTQISTRAATGSYFNPKSDRDPTLTPEDFQKLRDEEAQRLQDERSRRLTQVKQNKEAGGETRIRLQGIVGNSMIINGEMRSVGDKVNGVKLLKLGSNYVIGEYKGKKFKKILQ